MQLFRSQKSAVGTLIALGAICLFSASTSLYAQALPAVQNQADGPAYRPGEILIKFKAEVTDAQIAGAFHGAGLQLLKQIVTGPMRGKGELGLTHARTSIPVPQAVELLSRLPGIEYAQPNWVYTHQAVADDPYFTSGSLWGMEGANSSPANQFGSGAAEAWANNVTGSKAVYVGIIDEGIQYDHPDLAGNMWVNAQETAGNSTDDDANGYIDDIYGWNALNDNGNIYDPANDDHGTHVAGTIGAAGGNATGVVGVNWEVSLISGKFLGPNGGSTADAIQAIDYMTHLKTTKQLNLVALNNSWGGGGYDSALLEAITRAAQADILFVVAAGNGDKRGRAINTDLSPNYPSCYDTTSGAGYDSVISVTAIASDGSKASWANYGVTTVDLGAPGVSITSTLPGDNYGAESGTSMATPHVTGAIALYAAKYPGAKAAAIKKALLDSARATRTTSLVNLTVTGGRLNVPAFLATEPEGWTTPNTNVPPAAPSNFSATPVSWNQIKLAWTDNANNETGFVLTRTDGANSTTIQLGANLQTVTDTGLMGGTKYTYTLTAINTKGNSTAVSADATTLPPPPLATVTFKGVDATTQGNWLGNYGSEGYDILNYKSAPAYGTVTLAGYTPHTWASSTTDIRALRTPSGSSRFAACYYSSQSFTINVKFSDNNTHKLSLYCVDYDRQGRKQTIEIYDYNFPTNVLNAQTLENFGDGQYLSWNVQGSVIVKVIYPPGGTQNAVVSGIFLDDPYAPSALTAKAITRTQIDLSWKNNTDSATKFSIERSTSATSGFNPIGPVEGVSATTYSDTTVARNTTYYYRVRAILDTGAYTKYSGVASAKTPR